MKVVTCPNCGAAAKRTETRFGVRHDCCGLRSWGGKPLADEATMAARKAAHAAFDPIWRSKRMSRSDAYKCLSQHLGLPPEQCHIAQFDVATCARVLAFTQQIAPEAAA